MRSMLATVAMAFALGACASVPMAPTTADQEGKRFNAPPPGEGALYVYRYGEFAGTHAVSASAGQRLLGSLAGNTWFRVDLPPGAYDVRCTSPENTDSRVIQLAGGETRYVEVAMRIGYVVGPRCAVTEVPAETARQAILAGNRAQEIR